ncbi:hypothetical protein [Streptomyces sp. NPDC058398]|uniref:hypothetical protein n=1 Tax=Streptomyces sp. NPDC058398 TaxID=3346479 RepID=UPI00364FD19B
MTDHLRAEDGWLIVDDQQIAAEVDLGLFLPDTGPGAVRPAYVRSRSDVPLLWVR